MRRSEDIECENCADEGDPNTIAEWRAVAVIERGEQILSSKARHSCGDFECLGQTIAHLITHNRDSISVNVQPLYS